MSYRYWICESCQSDYVAVKDGKLRCMKCGGSNLETHSEYPMPLWLDAVLSTAKRALPIGGAGPWVENHHE